MIDPNEWFAMMRTAQRRNEGPILKAIKQRPDFDEVIYDVLLTTHYTAVEAADIAAEEAYIAAFNATYDKKHREIYTVVEYTPERPRRTISVGRARVRTASRCRAKRKRRRHEN